MHRTIVFVSLLLFIQACAVVPPKPGLGEPVPWHRLDDWDTDRHARAWPALLNSCTKLRESPRWRAVCQAAEPIQGPTDREAKAFFETYFQAYPVHGDNNHRSGLITGYYEPLLRGSFERSTRYRYPLYEPPGDLLRIDLGDVDPALANRQLRGRLNGRSVTPYPDRAHLQATPGVMSGSELIWVDDLFDAFFLHVQGSGRVLLPDGSVIALGYADHNGRPYRAIGKRLIAMGELARGDVNLFSIKRWLRSHPGKAKTLLHHNPRFVFFRLRHNAADGPAGSLNVPLTAGRSLAVDKEKIPLGAPVWLETSVPGRPEIPLNRLMMAQDTGSAIRGYNRADVFWGQGKDAERKAGLMKQPGQLFVLLPRD